MVQHATTSVFTDDSGTRRRLLLWSLRGVIAAIALAAAAVAFTLATGVPLPALGGPLGGGDSDNSSRGAGGSRQEKAADSDPAAPSASPTADVAPAATSRGTQAVAGPAAKPSHAPNGTPAATPSAPATPGSKANRGAAATDAPRADPTRDPHDPSKTPPGQIK